MKGMTPKLFKLFDVHLQTRSTDFPGNYSGLDDAWDLNKFKQVS